MKTAVQSKAVRPSTPGLVGELPDIVSLGRAGKLCETLTGVPRSRASIERYHRRGIRGQRLATFLVGGQRYVKVAELKRFLDAINADDAAAMAGAAGN